MGFDMMMKLAQVISSVGGDPSAVLGGAFKPRTIPKLEPGQVWNEQEQRADWSPGTKGIYKAVRGSRKGLEGGSICRRQTTLRNRQ